MSYSELSYCRRRGRNGSACKKESYSKDGVCAACKAELEELAEDLQYIKELNIIPDPRNMEREK